MDVAAIKSFVSTRKAQGLGKKDVDDLVELAAGGKGELSEAKAKELERVVAEYASLFTSTGSARLEKLTGIKTPVTGGASTGGSSAVDVRAGRSAAVPRSWNEVSSRAVATKISELVEAGDDVTLRLHSGREIPLEADEQMTAFIKKGYFKLYTHEKPEADDDRSGRLAYSLVPTPAFKATAAHIEKHAARAEEITRAVTSELEKLHAVMHAARVSGLGGPAELARIKAEVKAEIPKAKAAIIAYEQDIKMLAHDAQHIDFPSGEVDLLILAETALEVAGPKIAAPAMSDLPATKDLIRACELLLDRPEVEAVDPAFGIRIHVNTDVLVQNGGDYSAMKVEVTNLLRHHLITGELDFRKNNNFDAVIAAAHELLAQKVGATNVRGGASVGDKDFPDQVRGTEVALYVTQASALAEARRALPELTALFAPHVDKQHFTLRIDVAT